jgi:hypothetical protein
VKLYSEGTSLIENADSSERIEKTEKFGQNWEIPEIPNSQFPHERHTSQN